MIHSIVTENYKYRACLEYEFFSIRSVSMPSLDKTTNRHFLKAYEELTQIINKMANMPESHSFEFREAISKNYRLSSRRKFLDYIRSVRNIVAHPNQQTQNEAIQVSAEFLLSVEELIKELKNPITAKNIAINLKEVYYVSTNEKIKKISRTMLDRSFSHVPILDDNRKVLGVFNESALFSYFLSDDIIDANIDLTCADIIDHCKLSADRTETFLFVKPNLREEKIINYFTEYQEEGKRVGVLFVSPSGNSNDSITGLITAWDVLSAQKSKK